MMRIMLWTVGLFALAIGLAWLFQQNTGYAIVIFPPYRMEISLNAIVVLMAFLLGVMYLSLRMMIWGQQLPERVRRFRRRKTRHAARDTLRQAFLFYMEGRFGRAERLLKKSEHLLPEQEDRVLGLLLAAKSAHHIRNFEHRDQYLRTLETLGDSGKMACEVQRAHMLFDERRLEEALAALAFVRAQAPSLTAALKLELKIRYLQKLPETMQPLIEQLLANDSISLEEARAYRHAAWRFELEKYIDTAQLMLRWNQLPKSDRYLPEVMLPMVERFEKLGAVEAAAQTLAEALGVEWSGQLLQKLAELAPSLSEAGSLSLALRADEWLNAHREDPDLLLLLGHLALAQKLWGKAQNYLEASLSIAPSFNAHLTLARLFAQLDRVQDAKKHEQAALAYAEKWTGTNTLMPPFH